MTPGAPRSLRTDGDRLPTRYGVRGYADDPRVVMTLDAGGTTLVFGAVQGERSIVPPVTLSARVQSLDEFIERLLNGFRRVRDLVRKQGRGGSSLLAFDDPVAISFAFPGPADYERGVIGDLENLPVFRGGVPLGPLLEAEFDVPVLISNDGDLFALGESIAGFLPYVNGLLEQAGSPRRYRNLIGATLGTGFGCGVVVDGHLLRGDNSAAAEINRFRNRLVPTMSVEETVSVRGLRRAYAKAAGSPVSEAPSPKGIHEIALGKRSGDRAAARRAFGELAVVAGDALANAVSLVDGLVVLGGGLAGAHPLFMRRLVGEMNAAFSTPDGATVQRFESRAYDLEDSVERAALLATQVSEVAVSGTSRTVLYWPLKQVGVGVTRLGTASAVAVGAYTLALSRIDAG